MDLNSYKKGNDIQVALTHYIKVDQHAEGNLLKRAWWQYYDTAPKMVYTIMSIDATFKDEADSDFVCIQVWGRMGRICI